MRSSSRLSLFAILSGLVLASMPVWAAKYEYDMSCDGNDSLVSATAAAAWNCHSIVKNDNHVGYNGNGDYIETKNAMAMPITNIWVKYRSSDANGGRKLYLMPMDENGGNVAIRKEFSVPEKAKYFTTNFVFASTDGVRKLKIIAEGSSNTWIIHSLTIYTTDPPPTLGPISNQNIGSDNPITHLPVSAATSVAGDTLSVSVITASAIPLASYGVFEDSGDWFFRFSPEDAGMTSGTVIFTVSASGIGGTTSVSFTVTVEEGNVATPPVITPPGDQTVLARRPLTVPISAYDPGGDIVTFSVTGECYGNYSIGTYTGVFTFTPTISDVAISPITFTVQAISADGYDEETFDVYVTAGTPPALSPITDKTVAYDGTNKVTLALTPTDGDPITATNVDVKAGMTAPTGERTFSDLVFRFVPATADIGQTFTFTASATDFDGTTNVDFNVEVILAAPVLKHCSVEAWTATSFTADLKSAVPGATSYRLRHIHIAANDTVVTGYVDNVSFPYVVSGLDSTTYTYAVQAQCGAINSAWSNEETVHLDTYLPPTYAIPMTGNAHGSYSQNFDSLPSSGSGIWYDARTIPGWYVTFDGKSFTDGTIQTWRYGANNTATGFFSFGTEKGVDVNRGIGVKNSKWADDFRFGVAFTNTCQYAVTNINVSFTACQFRYGKGYTQLQLSHVVSNSVQSLTSSSSDWKDDEDFFFDPDLTQNAAAMDPQYTRHFSGDIALTGSEALQPGQILMLRWKNVAENNSVPVGIDDLEVKWQCAWPRHTVIILQ